jgi:phospholipase/carboxylesterase
MLRMTTGVVGDLRVRVVEHEQAGAPELIAVFCHGFGAPGDDLVPLAGDLVRRRPELVQRVRFLFPAAPLDLAASGIPGGRAWWPLDMLKMQAAIERGEFRDLRNESPELLPPAREKLTTLIDDQLNSTGLPTSRILLGGFSQGSMLATDVALRLEEAPAGMVIWSGTLLCEDQWRELAPRRAGLRVIQSHGYEDPLLPFEAAGWLRELFEQSGLNVNFLPFHGFHEIPDEALQATADQMLTILEGGHLTDETDTRG